MSTSKAQKWLDSILRYFETDGQEVPQESVDACWRLLRQELRGGETVWIKSLPAKYPQVVLGSQDCEIWLEEGQYWFVVTDDLGNELERYLLRKEP